MCEPTHALEQRVVARCRRGEASGAAQRGPASLASVDIVEVAAALVEILREAKVAVALDILRELLRAKSQLVSNAREDRGRRNPVELEGASAGEEREAVLDLSNQRRVRRAGERAVAKVEPERPVLLADEVEHGYA